MLVILACDFQPPLPHIRVQRPEFGLEGDKEVEGGLVVYPSPQHWAKLGAIQGHTNLKWDPKDWSRCGAGRGQVRPHA